MSVGGLGRGCHFRLQSCRSTKWRGHGFFICFFFQAEDGIRGDLVTGVQTCALPISLGLATGGITVSGTGDTSVVADIPGDLAGIAVGEGYYLSSGVELRAHSFLDRSEERRVGKECRSRRSPYH